MFFDATENNCHRETNARNIIGLKNEFSPYIKKSDSLVFTIGQCILWMITLS